MYMRMSVETTAIRVDGAEDTGFQPPFSKKKRGGGRHTQILHRQTAHVIQQPTVAFEHRPQRVRQGEDQVYPVAVRKTIQLCRCPQVCGLLSAGRQARLPHELVTYLTWGQSGLSQLYSFTSSIRVPQASIFMTASTPISRKPPASRKDVQHWLAVNRRFSVGAENPPTSGHQPSSPLLFRINQNDGRYGRT